MKPLALHWKILIGMLLGVIFGFLMLQIEWGAAFIAAWIKPLGTIFVKLLKLIAGPFDFSLSHQGNLRLKRHFKICFYWSKDHYYLRFHNGSGHQHWLDFG
jgi:L-cystine uptake protein TcyP (sodium:dicarboxylate symporter family)